MGEQANAHDSGAVGGGTEFKAVPLWSRSRVASGASPYIRMRCWPARFIAHLFPLILRTGRGVSTTSTNRATVLRTDFDRMFIRMPSRSAKSAAASSAQCAQAVHRARVVK